jgi:four helix bundle protein
MNNSQNSFQGILRKKADTLAHYVYKTTKQFPSEERYGNTSQIRRASLSVILNIIEGYTRKKGKEYNQFLRISYGSLQEKKYLLLFCFEEQLISKEDYSISIKLADEIGAMLWKRVEKIKE